MRQMKEKQIMISKKFADARNMFKTRFTNNYWEQLNIMTSGHAIKVWSCQKLGIGYDWLLGFRQVKADIKKTDIMGGWFLIELRIGQL